MNPQKKATQLIKEFGTKELALICAKEVRYNLEIFSLSYVQWNKVCNILES